MQLTLFPCKTNLDLRLIVDEMHVKNCFDDLTYFDHDLERHSIETVGRMTLKLK